MWLLRLISSARRVSCTRGDGVLYGGTLTATPTTSTNIGIYRLSDPPWAQRRGNSGGSRRLPTCPSPVQPDRGSRAGAAPLPTGRPFPPPIAEDLCFLVQNGLGGIRRPLTRPERALTTKGRVSANSPPPPPLLT